MGTKQELNESPQSVFLSYSQADLELVDALEEALRVQSISVWRDISSLHPSEQWPRYLGEVLQWTKALVLLWSAAASRSDFVELEWYMALVLNKPVLPVLLDETPLPAALHPVQRIKEPKIKSIVEQVVATPTILKSCSSDSAPWRDPSFTLLQEWDPFLRRLDEMAGRDPYAVLKYLKALERRALEGWDG